MKKNLSTLAIAASVLLLTATTFAQAPAVQPANQSPKMAAADRAWLDVRAAMFTPDLSRNLPAEPAARKAAMARHAASFTAAADQAKAFYATYPDHPKAAEARSMEVQALIAASKAGDATSEGRLNFTVEELRADPKMPIKLKAKTVAMHAFSLAMRGKKTKAEQLGAIEQVARNLTADFPTEPQGYESLLTVALATDDEAHARKISQDLLKGPSGDAVKEGTRAFVGRLDLVGKPIAPEVDGADAKGAKAATKAGRATVIYTWATWSPGSLELAAKLKKRGVNANVVALNLDEDTKAAEALAQKVALLGTAVYDERGREGALAQRLKFKAAPQVILVDAQGVIRDVRGEVDLDKKLTQLGL